MGRNKLKGKQKIHKSKMLFFEKVSKLDWPLVRIIKKKEKEKNKMPKHKV